MDRYTVVWAQDVQDEFAKRWLNSLSEEKDRLTKASDTIDRQLAVAPQRFGRVLHSEPNWRVWELPGFTLRIRVTFHINPGDRTVRVVRVVFVST